MYGLEAQGIPGSRLFNEADGRGALLDAEFVHSHCGAWFNEWTAHRLSRRPDASG